RLVCAIGLGLMLFAAGSWVKSTGAQRSLWNAVWIGPWLAGHVAIGFLRRYRSRARNILPNWLDIYVVVVFDHTIFHWEVYLTLNEAQVTAAVAKDAQQLAFETSPLPEKNV